MKRARAAAVLSLGLIGLSLVAGCGPDASRSPTETRPRASTQARVSATPTSTNAGTNAGTERGGLVARARVARVVVHESPGGRGKIRLDNPTAIGAPLTFLVRGRRPGWLLVQLPVRPNGSTGWVALSDVTVSATPYRLVISLSRHRLDVFRDGVRAERHRVGVGRSATPTPHGTYFLTELIRPPEPTGVYGPYAFGLSAFSNTLQTFGGGPGQIGLHGTDDPAGLGRDVSHGCLRVANAVITELAGKLPLGTPVEIRA